METISTIYTADKVLVSRIQRTQKTKHQEKKIDAAVKMALTAVETLVSCSRLWVAMKTVT